MPSPTTPRAIAERAAERGGDIIRAATPGVHGHGHAATDKGLPGDYVTAVDLASERAIASVLADLDPGVPILAEESGRSSSLGNRYWVVDPLDGTTNFVHRFPIVGVSVALVDDGIPVAGAVHAPFLGETYGAERGAGAWITKGSAEPQRLRVSERTAPRGVVGTGFPFRHPDRVARYLRAFQGALERFEDLRRPGTASLDLAWTAAGVFDGFFELSLAPWDVAAGALLVLEAGGRVTDWDGGQDWLSGDILAGPGQVHDELLAIARASA
ncbi:MAG: inositol monophosphatase family protein [Actinomycetota bacterium]